MAHEETPGVAESPVEPLGEGPGRGRPQSNPERLTSRERRRRIILLTLLTLLLALLAYFAYYFNANRRLPSLGIAPPGSDYIAPPQYLYSISGNGAGELSRPVGVGIAADGRVYVVDFGHRRVSVFTNAGRYLFSFTKTADGALINPVHLVVRGNEVWVSEHYHRCIYVFDLQGKYLRKFTPKHEALKWTPLAFTFDATGGLRVTDVGQTNKHRLIYFSADGSRTVTLGKTAQVNSLQESPGSFLFPNGVAVASNGDVYVSDGDNQRVQVFDSTGTFVRFLDTSGVPRGIAIDAKERVYVADALAHTIGVYDLKGKVLTDFGSRGFGPGQFNYPNDISIDRGGRIYISDRENDQVQVWGWPIAQLPNLASVKPALQWLLALCLLPFLLLPLLLLARRKVRIIVTPDFIDELSTLGEIPSVAKKPSVRLIAPLTDRELYEGKIVDGVDLGELISFEEYSESDARAIGERIKVAAPVSVLLAMSLRAKALGTEDHDLRISAMLAEVRVIDAKDFGEIYLKRDYRSSEGK